MVGCPHDDGFREFSPEGEDYLHRYSVKQGIDDGLILPVYFTLRHEMEWEIDEAGLDEEFERFERRTCKALVFLGILHVVGEP